MIDMKKSVFLILLAVMSLQFSASSRVYAQPASRDGSVGVQGTVTAPPPADAPIISIPGSGQTFSKLPVTVSGICSGDLLVKVFKNGVFAGSNQCSAGTFSLGVDLFSGKNDLIAKQYDLLDQESPASSVVTVTYNDVAPEKSVTERVVLSSNYAKRGANPRESLAWPIIITGGTGPYAVTIEWGDGETTLVSVPFPGEFTVEHKYGNPGVYNMIVKAVDSVGRASYLQLVAIGNGDLAESGTLGLVNSSGGKSVKTKGSEGDVRTRIVWQPAAIMIPFIVSTFWLGRRYAIYRIRKKIEAGERPFSY
jgi:hypothetical protein